MKGEVDRFSDEDADFRIQVGVAKLVKHDESQRVQQPRPKSALSSRPPAPVRNPKLRII